MGPYGPDLGEPGSQGYSERVEVRGKIGKEKRVRIKVRVRIEVKIGVRINVEIGEMRDVREIGIRGVRVVIDEIRILNN